MARSGQGLLPAAARHRVAIIVLDGTLALDLAVAVQAFGPRPAVFQKIRAENESPYEIELYGTPPVSCPTLGFSIGELHPVARAATADTVLVPGLDTALEPQDPGALAAIAEAARNGARLVSLCAGGADRLREPLTLETVAARAHVSSRTLARRFRAETGFSVQDWIALRRVEQARGLLEESGLTVSQIAYAVGFGSTESLRRHFRAVTGTSAREYRETFSAKAVPSV